MHPEAHDYAARFASDDEITVIDIGSRDINGTVRDLFPNADYTGIDLIDGPAVDIATDAATWKPKKKADLVVCCEVLEHCESWREVIANIATMLKKDGRVVLTAAGPNRAPHSGIDGGQIRADEFYENIVPADLADTLSDAGFREVEIDVAGADVRASAVK
jgi:2-polyprenyl-3-methyl-5-hydroxy-6-metoxy-1,4-benzoquinol methylase